MTEPVRESEGKAALGSISVNEAFLCGCSSLPAEVSEAGASSSWAHGDGVPNRLLSTAPKNVDLSPKEYVKGAIPGVTDDSGAPLEGTASLGWGASEPPPTTGGLCDILV